MSAVSDQELWAHMTIGAVSQVAEPFRTNLLRWLEEAVGCNWDGASPEGRLTYLEQRLVEWLSNLGPRQAMHNQQYIVELVRVCAAHFGTDLEDSPSPDILSLIGG